jgi:hypothetical protein
MKANYSSLEVEKVIAKCPKCKKKKTYRPPMPPNHTPYCPHGCLMPMFIDKVFYKSKTIKIKNGR